MFQKLLHFLGFNWYSIRVPFNDKTWKQVGDRILVHNWFLNKYVETEGCALVHDYQTISTKDGTLNRISHSKLVNCLTKYN